MKKRIMIGLVLICCVFNLPFFAKRAKAMTTDITPMTISSPGQADSYKDSDEGIVYSKEMGTTIYTINLQERGWLFVDLVDKNGTLLGPGMCILYEDASMTLSVSASVLENSAWRVKKALYLDAGTYYLLDKSTFTHAFAFFLPDSAVISHKLVKDKDNNGYTDTITFTPNLGTTYLAHGIVAPKDIKASDPWLTSQIKTNAYDVYSITDNGEYTVKAVFNDAEWKDFPVMYSFSVNDIGKDTKDDKNNNDKTKNDKTEGDSKTIDAKLNVTSKTIRVGESFKLKMIGTKVVSFKSSKKSVAKVSASGKVVGKKKGTATIKVTCDNGETYTCKVKVKK